MHYLRAWTLGRARAKLSCIQRHNCTQDTFARARLAIPQPNVVCYPNVVCWFLTDIPYSGNNKKYIWRKNIDIQYNKY